MRNALVPVLILAVFQTLPARAATAPGPDAFGYSAAVTTAYSFGEITNGIRVLYFSDDETLTVDIGFDFNFYGSHYTNLSFSPNGLITFGGASHDFNNVNLSTTVAPTNNLPCIAVLWDDWETQSVGSDGLYYRTEGATGSRQFILQWNKVIPVNGTGTDPVTFEARLFEGSSQILFSYLDVVVSDDPGYGNGAFATVGIRDADGQTNNRNLLWSCNQAVITNGESILFARANHAPLAVADTATTLENSPVVVAVLANDSDAEGDTLTVTSVMQATNGSTTINGGTNVTYRPNTNFKGTDSFVYTISDGWGGTASGLVTVNVWPLKVVSITRLPDKTLSVQFVGVPSRSYWIQTSSDMANWTSVALRTADTNGGFTFVQGPPSATNTFFRAMTSVPP